MRRALALRSVLPVPLWTVVLVQGTQHNGVETLAPHSKVERLLVDIDESVRKAGGDAEMVFANLFTHDQQLEESLGREIGTMNRSLGKLLVMQKTYNAELETSWVQLKQLGAAAQNSEQHASLYQAKASQTGKRFYSVLRSVTMLVELVQSAAVTPGGLLVTPKGEPSRIYSAIRQLLSANHAIKPRFPDVFKAFTPPPTLLSSPGKTGISETQERTGEPYTVEMTPSLLKRTALALSSIQARLEQQESQSLHTFTFKQQDLLLQAALAQLRGSQQLGMQAEDEQVIEELSFSIRCAETVLRLDEEFYRKLQDSMKSKAEMVEQIRHSRQHQLNMIKDLIDLLSGRYAVDEEASPLGLSFLGVKSRKGSHTGGLLFEIETGLHHKADMHGILMRIKRMLSDSAAIDTASVQQTVSELGSLLLKLGNDQAHSDEAKRRCEAQRNHAAHEDQELKASAALTSSVREHTKAAVLAARNNQRRIGAKAVSLQKSARILSGMVSQAMKTLGGHSKDRATIVAAVDKATDVIGQLKGRSSAAIAILKEMHGEFETQEKWEQKYRTEESSFHTAFMSYVRNYMQVLRERQGHYEHSLSEMQLSGTEAASDAAARTDSLHASGELEQESQELCRTILRFYEAHHQRNARLANALQVLLPRMPALLNAADAEVLTGTP